MNGEMKVIYNRRLKTYAIVLSLVAAGIVYPAFRTAEPSVSIQLRKWTLDFEISTRRLEETAQAFKASHLPLDTLQAAVVRTREAFKRIEFALAYYYPEYTEEHLNGAPLLHIERNDTRPVVVEPEGLQVLDEMVYAGNTFSERVRITALTQKLKASAAAVCAHLKTRNTPAHELVEAQRLQLIRIFTLGITGFDTPGSQHAQHEAAIALQALKDIDAAIQYDTHNAPPSRLSPLFDSALAPLQKSVSFEAFDRLAWLRNGINPLYKALRRTQTALKSPGRTQAGWNAASEALFSDDFLDPYYFTSLSRQEDSPALRTLGQTLFYDPLLSGNGTMSCASCHNPALAFSDGKTKSASVIEGQTVQRNAPTLINAVYADRYFYDLRAFSLEQQAEHVIFNRLEFNTAHDAILQKLQQSKTYPARFRTAFGTSAVTRQQFAKALVSYVMSLRSFNSPFDRYARGETNTLDPVAALGFNLFMGKAGCGTCHFPPTFAGLVPPLYFKNESEILGIPQDPNATQWTPDPDKGRYDNTLYSEQAWIYERSFKTTTIRNTELTAPYFHNGAYNTLEDVIDFYDRGGGTGRGMRVTNQTLPADSLRLSVSEKKALVAFMKSLTDTTGTMHIPKPGTY